MEMRELAPAQVKALQGHSVDRVGNLRIIHVFEDFTAASEARLVQTIRAIALESDGRVILSLLESCDIDRACVKRAIEELSSLRPRLTVVAAPWVCADTPFGDRTDRVRCASCFGEVFPQSGASHGLPSSDRSPQQRRIAPAHGSGP